jgi:hypothetical protein
MMKKEEAVQWLQAETEPIRDLVGRNAYRCSAYLHDGLYLPCVLIRESQAYADLALKRFQQARDSGITDPKNIVPGYYPTVVKRFITSGNQVNLFDIERVEISSYAIPLCLLKQVHGETRMSWTQFAVLTDNGIEYSFGTTYNMEFFNIPDGFSWDNVTTVISHRSETKPIYRERPYFTCFIDDIDFGEFQVKKAL